MSKRKKKKDERTESSTGESPSVHVSVSGHSLDEVHDKIAAIHGRGAKRGSRRKSKRSSHRE